MNPRRILAVAGVLWVTLLAGGCRRPQELPVVVSVTPEGATLHWQDARGPLRGEVPWVLRTDLLGPETYLVVGTADGDRCARRVSFRVLAGGATEYGVTLVSDLGGRVSWRVVAGGDRRIKLFTCAPRPADDPRQECLAGGIPKPLLGELIGSISAELEGGALAEATSLRFERALPCRPGASGTVGGETADISATPPEGPPSSEPR